MSVILDNGEVLPKLPRDSETAERVIRIDSVANLSGYEHPLPSLKYISYDAYLRDYEHSLTSLVEIGGMAILSGYAHHMPSLKKVRGSIYLIGYKNPLPSLEYIGRAPDLGRYCCPLPSLKRIRGDASLHGYAHIPDWIGYVGNDSRGKSFWADLLRNSVRGGWHNFTPEEALDYWWPDSPGDYTDSFELVKKAIALIPGTEILLHSLPSPPKPLFRSLISKIIAHCK